MYTFEYDTPEARGIPSPALLKFLARLEKIDFVHGLVLMRHGKVAAEGMRSRSPARTFVRPSATRGKR